MKFRWRWRALLRCAYGAGVFGQRQVGGPEAEHPSDADKKHDALSIVSVVINIHKYSCPKSFQGALPRSGQKWLVRTRMKQQKEKTPMKNQHAKATAGSGRGSFDSQLVIDSFAVGSRSSTGSYRFVAAVMTHDSNRGAKAIRSMRWENDAFRRKWSLGLFFVFVPKSLR
mmetsp:Transcript_17317/g.32872  ORF Transcript_17317/g.32872 Transcript_17317/m.32872 type:complete len:170 (-) Transcript_17317:684-1193(-)